MLNENLKENLKDKEYKIIIIFCIMRNVSTLKIKFKCHFNLINYHVVYFLFHQNQY